MEKYKKDFNIIINGVGGQGIITLLQIISQAALIEGLEVRTSELHGLSQRGGSVSVFIRFGKNIFSPLPFLGSGDLIMGLEGLEGLRSLNYANSKTIFLINNNFIPFQGELNNKEIENILNKIKNKKFLIPASKICKEKLDSEIVSGIYLIGFAVYKKLLPLKEKSVLKAIEEVVPQKYLELNKAAFELAKL